jgi:hypothetical protein
MYSRVIGERSLEGLFLFTFKNKYDNIKIPRKNEESENMGRNTVGYIEIETKVCVGEKELRKIVDESEYSNKEGYRFDVHCVSQAFDNERISISEEIRQIENVYKVTILRNKDIEGIK